MTNWAWSSRRASNRGLWSSSNSENPSELSRKNVHSVRLDSRANLHNWKRRLSADEITRVRQLTEEVAYLYYPDVDWS